MNNIPPLPPTVRSWNQNFSDWGARPSSVGDIIWGQSLFSSDRGVEPKYQGPTHAFACPIASQSQVSIMKFHPVLIASNNVLQPNVSDNEHQFRNF